MTDPDPPIFKQPPTTIASNAAIMMLYGMAALEIAKDRTYIDLLRKSMDNMRTSALGKSNPDSMTLIDALMNDLGKNINAAK